jgi:hypothetical protein
MAAMAAKGAVSVRITRGPRRMPVKPWALASLRSSLLSPPSGPTRMVTLPLALLVLVMTISTSAHYLNSVFDGLVSNVRR